MSSSLAIGILTMPGEEDDTRRVVRTLSVFASPSDTIFVHLNGSPLEPPGRDLVSDLERLGAVVTASASNLGDVGGRNRLTNIDGFVEHDAGVFLDNDIVVSPTLLNTFRAGLTDTASEPRLGALATPVYAYPRLKRFVPEAFSRLPGADDAEPTEIFDVSEFSRRNRGRDKPIRPSNSGANLDWRIAYLSAIPYVARAFRLKRREWCRSVQEYPDFWDLVDDGAPIPASALPGGVSCVPMRHLTDPHPFDDIFRPYGAGDTSFSIGLHERGFSNFVLGSGAIPHGTHARHAMRRSPGPALADEINRARGRTLLAARHGDPQAPPVASMRKVLGDQVLGLSRGEPPSDRSIWAVLVGGLVAERQLDAPESAVCWNLDIPVSIAALSPTRFVGSPGFPLRRVIDLLRGWRSLADLLEDDAASVDDAIDAVTLDLVTDRDEVLAALTSSLTAGEDALAEAFADIAPNRAT